MARRVIKKLCMLGDGAVGKTSLTRRYVFDTFEEDYTPTIGTKIVKKLIELPEKDMEMMFMIWDIMGHKTYHEIPPQYYQGVEGVIVVADVTRKETLKNTSYWLRAPFQASGKVPAILVVNKFDLKENAEFDEERSKAMGEELEVPVYFTSAKTGDKVEKLFRDMAEMLTSGL